MFGSAQGGLGLKFGAASALSRAIDALVQECSSNGKKEPAENPKRPFGSVVTDLAKEGLRRRKAAEAAAAEARAAAGPQAGTATDEPQEAAGEKQELAELPLKYEILRQVLVVVIFIVLHQLSEHYIFEPWRGGGDHKAVQAAILRNGLRQNMCPPGAEDCSHSINFDQHIPSSARDYQKMRGEL